MGRLVLIDYNLFDGDNADSNPAYPEASTFPHDTHLLSNYSPLANIQGIDKFDSKTTMFYGHLWQSNQELNTIVITIRGTSNMQEWIDDAKFEFVPFSDKKEQGKVELGFNEIFTSFTVMTPDTDKGMPLSEYLNRTNNVDTLIVVGHSLGSSLATLVAYTPLR